MSDLACSAICPALSYLGINPKACQSTCQKVTGGAPAEGAAACGDERTEGKGEGMEPCQPNTYKCDEQEVLYRCEGKAGSENWVAVERCGLIAQVCDATLPGCKPADIGSPEQVCETKEVIFDCCSTDRTWESSRECGPNEGEECHTGGFLCADGNYHPLSLWEADSLSITFSNIGPQLNKLTITHFGLRMFGDTENGSVQVDDLPSKQFYIPGIDICDPALITFGGEELISPATGNNVASDGQVRIVLYGPGSSGGAYTVSRMLFTFCGPETKPNN